jgi:hypothetical protein
MWTGLVGVGRPVGGADDGGERYSHKEDIRIGGITVK